MTPHRTLVILLLAATPLWIAGCGGNTDGTIGGTLTGLSASTSVTLLDNGTDAVTLTGNETFEFPTSLGANASYAITVSTEPVGETCIVTDGSGAVDSADDPVDTVVITCSTTLQLTGSVTGLDAGTSLVLSNGQVLLPLATNGAFSFPGTVGVGNAYAVTVSTQPAGETCTVTNGSGTVSAAGVPAIVVTCS